MIKLIVVGSIKEKFFKEAIAEYTKRLSKYTKLEIIEVKDYDLHNPNLNKEKEKNEIFKHISDRDYIITLEIEGQKLDSISFSKKINDWTMMSANVVFVIGGSDGISDDIKERSNYALSFSDMTFPHQLFRIMLLEQIYRSFKIINNESYHK